ncbi:hypothetical protein FDH38_gp080 [Dinoroseobacter phage vB_DshS-R5C]|uniref:Uncharacterized protein n=1 Tax=Dinoroseobacter phage vB_DshS-R5C TaxID=1965368 RepID=A0A1V0DY87_9CAUD|nr:hypothetical protein FDH38_gp080 [Dinoroseobacter phage vB_DshS-R5C]ARB06134.1 hypothetical protein vBDshSR5C_80 [Dinoroseobacter phage vB_DshS-R5C]
MNIERINARFIKNHGEIVRTWDETQRDSQRKVTYAVTMCEHADGFKRVLTVAE